MNDHYNILIHQPESMRWARTTCGEQARVLVSPLQSGQPVCIMDYRAPAHFGPPRHIHFRDDEILRVLEGNIVVWGSVFCGTAGPGDIVVLPKGIPHTWRSREQSVHMEHDRSW